MSEQGALQHLDLDALADALAEGTEPAHLAGCATCRARLAELAAVLPRVSDELASLAPPVPPAGLAERLDAALAAEAAGPGGDVLPLVRRDRRVRWLPALTAAAAALVVVTGGVLLAQRGDHNRTSADQAGGATSGYALNASGTDYTRTGTELQAQLPALLKGTASGARAEAGAQAPGPVPYGASTPGMTAQKDTALTAPAGPDPLAPLRTTQGLATCLASLSDPGDAGLPLALDYASFEGHPALVVVLPASDTAKVDVFVVPPGCAKADGNVYYFRRLPRP